MEQEDEDLLYQLIVLFVFDKMDIALDDSTVLNICCVQNSWLAPIFCMDALQKLVKSNFINKISRGRKQNPLYTLTSDGRVCLANFYPRIPESMRQEISDYVRENRMAFKRQQEYTHTYYKNYDGTYTVWLRIKDPSATLLDLKFVVANHKTAKYIHENWEKKAANVYLMLRDQLLE